LLMTFDFIMEIGMPLEYSYKMKSLVLFMKPKHNSSSNSITKVFEKCVFGYRCLIVQAKDPSVVAEKKSNELTKKLTKIVKEEKVRAGIENVLTCTSALPKAMNNSVPQEGPTQQGTNMSFLKSTDETIGELLKPLLFILIIDIIFLSICLIFDQGQEE